MYVRINKNELYAVKIWNKMKKFLCESNIFSTENNLL